MKALLFFSISECRPLRSPRAAPRRPCPGLALRTRLPGWLWVFPSCVILSCSRTRSCCGEEATSQPVVTRPTAAEHSASLGVAPQPGHCHHGDL